MDHRLSAHDGPRPHDPRDRRCARDQSTNGVGDHLKALERKGYIQRDASLSRSIVVLRNAEGEDLAEIAGEDKDAIIAALAARIAELEAQLAAAQGGAA